MTAWVGGREISDVIGPIVWTNGGTPVWIVEDGVRRLFSDALVGGIAGRGKGVVDQIVLELIRQGRDAYGRSLDGQVLVDPKRGTS